MSTKSTVAYGDNFHLFKDCFDEENVYLQLDNVHFIAELNTITVSIPLSIWETIRKKQVADLTLVNKSDEDILKEVTEFVKKRKSAEGIMRVFGSAVYGDISLAEEEQIKNGMNYFIEKREIQQKLKSEIENLSKKT